MQTSVFQASLPSEKVTNSVAYYNHSFTCMPQVYTFINTHNYKRCLNCCQMYDNYQQNNRMEGKNPMEVKGLVGKWQLALVTPSRNVTALEANLLLLVARVFTEKRTI